MRWKIAATLAMLGLAMPAAAHDGVVHKSAEEARKHLEQTTNIKPIAAPPVVASPLPFKVGGPFTLIDGNGAPRTQADPDGQHQLLFFGYANCPSICAVALPMMAQSVDALAAQGIAVRPVMITIDPERDTVDTIHPALHQIHARFSGLTGATPDLHAAWDAFGVERKIAFEDPELGPIYAHGSHVFLLTPGGDVLTLLPPILRPDRVTEIVKAYVAAGVPTQ